MGRTRQLQDMRTDVLERADCVGASDRHTPTYLNRCINQGRAALRDEIIKARGRSYFRKQPAATITTGAGLVSGSTTKYTLPPDFYQLISIRTTGDLGDNLEPFTPLEEPALRSPFGSADWPSHYELQESAIELLPSHRSGLSVALEYIPTLTEVTGDTDLVDGYVERGLDFIRDHAALELAVKDDEPRVVQYLERALGVLQAHIASLAPKRDRFRAERVKDVRGTRMFGGYRR